MKRFISRLQEMQLRRALCGRLLFKLFFFFLFFPFGLRGFLFSSNIFGKQMNKQTNKKKHVHNISKNRDCFSGVIFPKRNHSHAVRTRAASRHVTHVWLKTHSCVIFKTVRLNLCLCQVYSVSHTVHLGIYFKTYPDLIRQPG